MRVANALKQAAVELDVLGDADARRAANLLMMHVLKIDRASLVMCSEDNLSQEQFDGFRKLVFRAKSEPVHRILGHREFHGLALDLHPQTLEPRDDSETVIEIVLEHLSNNTADDLRFVDLGTGTGALTLALLTELPNATALLTDIQDGALETAAANATKHGLQTRCGFAKGPWLEPVCGLFKFIVSNPPYISCRMFEKLDPAVRNHDPRLALDGGEDGLDAYRIILRDAAPYLEPDGFLAIEIGFDQARSVRELAEQNGWTFQKLAQDLGGNDRAMVFTP